MLRVGINGFGTIGKRVADATPAGVGAQNRPLYEDLETPAIYQGGEDATVAPVKFQRPRELRRSDGGRRRPRGLL